MDITQMLSGFGGITGFAAQMDNRLNCPPGCFQKLFNMAEDYDRTLHLLMIQHPEASRSDLRHILLPPVVARIYRDWSPQKQEYIVWAGVKTWFGEESWDGLGEHCTKNVNKQGFMSGPGDRALFGDTPEKADQYCSPDEKVYWSEDEEVDEDKEMDEDKAESGNASEAEKNEDGKGKKRKGKGKGKTGKAKTTQSLERKIATKAKEKARPSKAATPRKRILTRSVAKEGPVTRSMTKK